MTYRASSRAGDGATASATTLVVPFPTGSVAGDACVIVSGNSFNGVTITTPSGWTLLSGPDDSGGADRAYMFGKVLSSGDISTGSVTLTYSGAARAAAVAASFNTGGHLTPFGVPTNVSFATSAPFVTTTQFGSDVALFQVQAFAGPGQAPAVTFSQGNDLAARTNIASGLNMGTTGSHIAATGTGSYGGGTMAGASNATNYASQAYAVEIKNIVANQAPNVTVTANQNVSASATVGVTISASDIDGSIASYATTVTRYTTTAAPASVTVTNGTTNHPTWTGPAAGGLDVVTVVVTDDDGATTTKTTEVRCPTSGELLPLRGYATAGVSVTNTGGAASLGEAMSDSSDSTYGEWPTATGTEQELRQRLCPSLPRSDLTGTHRLFQDNAGSLTDKVRLYQASTGTGTVATLVKEWVFSSLTTSAAAYVGAANSTDIGSVADWGNLWIADAETT